MAAKRKSGTGLIHCEHCGEYYSDTYRRCPFCDEYDEYEEEYEDAPERPAPRGGKRLTQPARRGGGYTRFSPLWVISVIVSLAIIAAAVWIVATKLWPLIKLGSVGTVDPSSTVTQPADPDPDSSPEGTAPDSNADDSAVDPPDATPTPAVTPTPVPSGVTGFSLSKTEFAFSDRYPDPVTLTVAFTPADAADTVTWSSSNPSVASVDENGKVSHGTKAGSATITATLSNGLTQTCKVYNQITGSTAPNSGGDAGTYTVNNADLTFYTAGEQFTLKVNGYTGSVTWTSSDTGVATVDSSGTCTAVGTGTGSCTVTGTLENGSTVQAIVRIDIS